MSTTAEMSRAHCRKVYSLVAMLRPFLFAFCASSSAVNMRTASASGTLWILFSCHFWSSVRMLLKLWRTSFSPLAVVVLEVNAVDILGGGTAGNWRSMRRIR